MILSFAFIGPVPRVTRLAVLCQGYNGSKSLHFVELDFEKNKAFDDHDQLTNLPDDTYFIFPLMQETHSIIMAFSTSTAIRITYAMGIKPEIITYTIFTQSRIVKFSCLSESIFAFVDEEGKVKLSNIKENERIYFDTIAENMYVSDIIPIQESLLFFVGHNRKSSLFKLESKKLVKLQDIESPGSIEKIYDDPHEIALGKNAIIKIARTSKYVVDKIFKGKSFTSIWAKSDGKKLSVVCSSLSHSLLLEYNGQRLVKPKNEIFISNFSTLHFSFEPYIQVTPISIRFEKKELYGNFNGAASDDSRVFLIQNTKADIYDVHGKYLQSISQFFTTGIFHKNQVIAATPTNIIIYDNSFNPIESFSISSPAISLTYNDEYILCTHSRDSISLVGNTGLIEIPAAGYHTNSIIFDNDIIIFGETPMIYKNNKLSFYGTQKLLDGCVISSNQILLLCSDSIILANNGEIELLAQNPLYFGDENGTVEHIQKVDDIFILSNKNKLSLSNHIEGNKMVIYETEDPIIGFVYLDGVVVLSTYKYVYVLNYDPPVFCNTIAKKDFINNISIFGYFDNYLYTVHINNIVFFVVEKSSHSVSIIEMFEIQEQHPIKCVSSSPGYFVMGLGNGEIHMYQLIKSNLVKFASFHVPFDLTCIEFYKSSIVFGTADGIIGVLSQKDNQSKDLVLSSASKISSQITSISQTKSGLIIGTILGELFTIFEKEFPRVFLELYEILEQRVFSIGHLCKILERAVGVNNSILQIQPLIDNELISLFTDLSSKSRNEILADTKYSEKEALDIISSINVLY